ncbi:MAG: OmpA family protein [Flavobacteriales bacterium]|nr:OmpA family protein [Bacteroidota bacterium]MCB9240620.1 OmpA family protein [Flavobacteriales bacterium]
MTRLAIFVLLFVTSSSLKAQEGTSISILFDSDQHVAKSTELSRLHSFLEDEDCGSCFLVLSGHTDSDGADQYNIELSQKRVNTIRNYIKKEFGCFDVQDTDFFGESKPLNENANNQQKQANRRVTVQLNCSPKKTDKDVTPSEPILIPQDVWSSVVSPPSDGINKRIFSNEYTTIEAGNGVVVVIEPHAFSLENKAIDVTFLQCTSRQKAFNMGFTTQTSDSLLESGGMFRILAKADGRPVEQLRPDAVHVFIPNSGPDDFEGFTSYMDESYVHWEKRDELKPENFSPGREIAQFFDPGEMDIQDQSGTCERDCNLFWCKIKSALFPGYRKRRDENLAACIGSNGDIMRIYDLFKNKLNGEFPDRESFAKYLAENKRDDIMNKLRADVPQIDEVSYYVLDLPNARWINCDRFLGEGDRTTVLVDEDYNTKWDVRLFFDDQLSVMRAAKSDKGKIQFANIPIGELVTLVIVKKLSDVIYLSKETFRTGDTPIVNFKKVSTDDLKYVFDKEQSLGSSSR